MKGAVSRAEAWRRGKAGREFRRTRSVQAGCAEYRRRRNNAQKKPTGTAKDRGTRDGGGGPPILDDPENWACGRWSERIRQKGRKKEGSPKRRSPQGDRTEREKAIDSWGLWGKKRRKGGAI